MSGYRIITLGFVAALAFAGVNALAQTINAPQGTPAKSDHTLGYGK